MRYPNKPTERRVFSSGQPPVPEGEVPAQILPKTLQAKNYYNLTEYLPNIRHDGGIMLSIPLFFMPLSRPLPASDQPVTGHPLSGRIGRSALPHTLLPKAMAVLLLGLLAGCAASGMGDNMASNDSDRSA